MRFLPQPGARTCRRGATLGGLALLFGLLLLTHLSMVHGQTPGPTAPPLQSITVTGNGNAAQSPDVASVSGEVQSQATTSSDAVNQASQTLQAVIAAAKGVGARDADIQTSGLSLYPLFTPAIVPAPSCIYTPPGAPLPSAPAVPPGAAAPTPYPPCATPPAPQTPTPPAIYAYQATEGITVKTTDLAHVGTLIADLVSTGLTDFSGPSYGVQNPENLRVQAVQAAMADAQTIAQAIAAEAGVQLGPLLSVSTGYVNTPPSFLAAAPPPPLPFPVPTALPQVASVPVQPSTLSAQANVTASYAILTPTPTPAAATP